MSRSDMNMTANKKSVLSDKKYIHSFGVQVTEDQQLGTHGFAPSET